MGFGLQSQPDSNREGAEVSEFLFDETLMTSGGVRGTLLAIPDYSENGLSSFLANRDKNAKHPVHDYDTIVYGPIARRWRNIRIAPLCGRGYLFGQTEELKYAKGITFQYFFGTERALSKLKTI